MIHDDLSVLKNFMWAIINAPIVDLYLPQRSTGDMFIRNIIDNISFYICSVSLIMVNICQLSCFDGSNCAAGCCSAKLVSYSSTCCIYKTYSGSRKNRISLKFGTLG